MPSRISRLSSLVASLLFIACLPPLSAHADSASDRAELQKKLNEENLNSSFQAEDAAKIDTYVKDAMKKDLKPKTTPPQNWQPGYTCDSYYHHYYAYNYYGYRDCLYHYRYYGRYW